MILLFLIGGVFFFFLSVLYLAESLEGADMPKYYDLQSVAKDDGKLLK